MTLKIAGLLLTLAALPAWAHEGAPHVKGIIKEVTAGRLVITQPSGQDAAFALTKATEFYVGRKPVGRDSARPGERAVIHGAHGAATPTAAVVMLADAPAGR